MNETDKELIFILGEGIPLVSQPFAEIAHKLNISEEEVLTRIKRSLDSGVIRRFGASIRHRQVGMVANAMVVWKAPQANVEEVGKKMARFKEVTHCYERRTIPGKWEYNLFCVIHGHDEKICKDVAREISKVTGVKDYTVLFSEREFKKTNLKFTRR